MNALLFSLLLLVPGARAEDGGWDARLTKSEGEVVVYPAGAEESSEPETDMPLDAGDRIETGADGRAEVALDSESLVEIGPKSVFTVESLDEKESWLSLKLGSLTAKLKKLAAGRSLRVRTPSAVAAVRGTEFAVDVPEEGETRVGVFDEGRVEVSGEQGSTELSANQETQVLRGRAPGRPAALKRFKKLRARIVRLRERRETVRKAWKALPVERRRELRRSFMERRAGKLQERRERLQEKRERRKDGRGAGQPQQGGEQRMERGEQRQGRRQEMRQGAQQRRQDRRRRPDGRP
ncbi:MAG: FecR domain-containing protein [Elusimicrobiota bacterium]|jgi:hypothetical protein